jgi:metal-responsive CopG/Arc/MetJ family transcriptional regulator
MDSEAWWYDGGMKVKTSVSLSEQLLCEIDREIGEDGNRSQFVEKALKRYFRLQRKAERDAHDAAIYAKHADKFNAETEDVLADQDDPFELVDEVEPVEAR